MMSIVKLRLSTVVCLVALVSGCGKDAMQDHAANDKAFLEKGQVSHAVIELKNAVEAAPVRADMRFLVSAALQRNGELFTGEIKLRKAGTLGDDANMVKPALITLLLESGRPQDASGEGTLDGITQPAAKALSIFPVNETATIGTARIALWRGDMVGGKKILEKVLATNLNALQGLRILGEVLGAEGKAPEAVALYDRAFEVGPNDLRAFSAAIPLLINAKDLLRAIVTRCFDAPIAYADNRKELATEKAQQLVLQRQQFHDAMATSRKLVERLPESALASSALGMSLRTVKDRANARQAYEAEAQLLPKQSNREGMERVLRTGVAETGNAEMVATLVAALVANGKTSQGKEVAIS